MSARSASASRSCSSPPSGPRPGAGWGWQAGLGAILAAIGASSVAIPGLNDLLWPIVLVVLGGLLLIRAGSARA